MSLPDHSKEIAALLNQLIPLDITEMIISYLSEVHLARRCCWQYEVDMQVIRASYGISCGIGRSYAHIVETETPYQRKVQSQHPASPILDLLQGKGHCILSTCLEEISGNSM